MNINIKKLLEEVEGNARAHQQAHQHEAIEKIFKTWGFTPSDSIIFLMEMSIGTALMCKKDGVSYESVLDGLEKSWKGRMESAWKRAKSGELKALLEDLDDLDGGPGGKNGQA